MFIEERLKLKIKCYKVSKAVILRFLSLREENSEAEEKFLQSEATWVKKR